MRCRFIHHLPKAGKDFILKSLSMMKNIILTTLFLLAGKASFGQVAPTDWQKMNLKGKVKAMTEIIYVASEKFGKIEKDKIIIKYEYSFHENGYLAYQNVYNSEDKLMDRTTFEYDAQNNLIEGTRYDKNNKIALRSIYTTHKQDKSTTIKCYTSDGSLTGHYTQRYNAQKLLQETIYREPMVGKEAYQYDAKGGLVYIGCTHPELGLELEEIFVVDAQNNEIKKTSLRYEAGKVHHKILSSYQYTYDEKGNWTTCIQFETETNIAYKITERTYTYY